MEILSLIRVKMEKNLNAKAFGYSLGIVSGFIMLILGILGNLGLYLSGVSAMAEWHIFFDLSVLGIIAGIIEAGIFGFVFGWLVAVIYNRISKYNR